MSFHPWAPGAPSGHGPKSLVVPGVAARTHKRLVCDGKLYGVILSFEIDGVQHFAALYGSAGHVDHADWIEVDIP